MCINYAPLNQVTNDFIFPINDCMLVLESLGGSSVFTGLDIKAGFHNIPMKANDKQYTVFVTPDGAWQWRRMPFGLKGAPAHF